MSETVLPALGLLDGAMATLRIMPSNTEWSTGIRSILVAAIQQPCSTITGQCCSGDSSPRRHSGSCNTANRYSGPRTQASPRSTVLQHAALLRTSWSTIWLELAQKAPSLLGLCCFLFGSAQIAPTHAQSALFICFIHTHSHKRIHSTPGPGDSTSGLLAGLPVLADAIHICHCRKPCHCQHAPLLRPMPHPSSVDLDGDSPSSAGKSRDSASQERAFRNSSRSICSRYLRPDGFRHGAGLRATGRHAAARAGSCRPPYPRGWVSMP